MIEIYDKLYNFIKESGLGKKLPDAVYLHKSALGDLDLEYPVGLSTWNLLKVHNSARKISFLKYEQFDELPHPYLVMSSLFDQMTGVVKVTHYEARSNPPILHRKELFVTEDYPLYLKFKTLTQKEEELGLYENSRSIGFKLQWEKLLEKKGVTYKDHTVIVKNNEIFHSEVDSAVHVIDRYKTAITRFEPSRPVKSLIQNNLLKGRSFFDYGCGQGDDLQCLQKMAVDAQGWDPHFQADKPLIESDVVNLGFILNIIEDSEERVETLKKAFALASKLLVVSVMTEHQENYADARLYQDGFLTNRNTFQKYFTQEEIKLFIEENLSVDATAVSLGIFYIFKSESLKQDFIASSVKRQIDWRSLSSRKHKEKQYIPRLNKYEKNQSLFDSFWHTCLEMGRLPRKDEFEFYDEVRRVAGSLAKGLRVLAEQYDITALEDARQKRIEDLEVYFCMSKFSKRMAFKNLSPSLQYDIKSFFGSYTDLEKNAMDLLTSSGDPDNINQECKKIKFGRNEKETFQFHSMYMDELPVLLRVYVQCGSILYGNLRDGDVVKIHKNTGKLSVMFYDHFWKKAHPELKLRVKLKLRGQKVDVFDYSTQDQIQLLYEKDSYISDNHPDYPKFAKLTDKEIENGLLSFSGLFAQKCA